MRRIPDTLLDKMLADPSLFEELECELTDAEKAELLNIHPEWSVFGAIARLAADRSLSCSEVMSKIEELAGFKHLLDVREAQFFSRGHVLRCFRIVQKARTRLNRSRYRELPRIEAQAEHAEHILRCYHQLAESVAGQDGLKADVAAHLERTLGETARASERLAESLDRASRILEDVYDQLVDCNAEAALLREINVAQAHVFSTEERAELLALFGCFGLDARERLRNRQLADFNFLRERMIFGFSDRASTDRN